MADLPIEPKPLSPIETRRILTPEELIDIWQQDEFWGCSGGSFTYDNYTGKRTKVN